MFVVFQTLASIRSMLYSRSQASTACLVARGAHFTVDHVLRVVESSESDVRIAVVIHEDLDVSVRQHRQVHNDPLAAFREVERR